MPIDTNMYVNIIKNLSPEQAKRLSKKMDTMQAKRSLFAVFGIIFLATFFVLLSLI